MAGQHRRYSDDERANAMAALAANGGNIEGTAKQLGIPSQSLRNWAKGLSHHPATTINGEAKKESMAEALERVAWQLLQSLPSKIDKAALAQVATAMGIAIDKARLLRGQPTAITENQDGTPPSELPLDELRRKRAELRTADRAGVPRPGDSAAEPA